MVVGDSLYCSLLRHSTMKVDFSFYSLCCSQSWFNVFLGDFDYFLSHLIFSLLSLVHLKFNSFLLLTFCVFIFASCNYTFLVFFMVDYPLWIIQGLAAQLLGHMDLNFHLLLPVADFITFPCLLT